MPLMGKIEVILKQLVGYLLKMFVYRKDAKIYLGIEFESDGKQDIKAGRYLVGPCRGLQAPTRTSECLVEASRSYCVMSLAYC